MSQRAMKFSMWSGTYFKISPVGLGKSTVTIRSSIIGIFQMKFFTVLQTGERAYIQPEEDVEIVIGRDKVPTFLQNMNCWARMQILSDCHPRK